MLIQAAQKDILLTYFVTECKLGKWTEGTLGELNESLEKVDEEKAIYLYFERIGLIDCRDNEFSFMSVSFRVNVEAA